MFLLLFFEGVNSSLAHSGLNTARSAYSGWIGTLSYSGKERVNE